MPVGASAALGQVERIVSSDTFRPSENLRRLLTYLCDRSVAGETDGLKEYIIGVEAFGRPAGYDPQQDSTVRVHAGKLRQKLEEYYRSEGASDSILVGFPKGGFKLVFENRPVQESTARRSNPWKVASISLACALLVCVAVMVWPTQSPSNQVEAALWSSELEQFWQPFLDSPRPLLISLGTPLFLRLGTTFFRNPDLNDLESARAWSSMGAMERAAGSLATHPVHLYTGVGEATAAFELVRLLGSRRPNISIKRAPMVTWDDIVNNNVIFLGSPKYNSQLKNFPIRQELILEPGVLRNLVPKPGEPVVLQGNWPRDSPYCVEDYGLLTRIPGPNNRGEILILAASSTEGTLSAAQFVTQPTHAAQLATRIRLSSGGLPRHYQVVIHSLFKDMVPVKIDYLFHHVLDRSRAPQ